MTTATTMAATEPVIGVFEDLGYAEHAAHDLRAAGFDRVALSVEEPQTVAVDQPPPPATLSTPLAITTSLVSGVVVGILAAIIAPHDILIRGFGWRIGAPLILSLVAGLIGWLLGGILGFGILRAPVEEEPYATTVPATHTPFITVTVQAPGRPAEARAILLRAGAHLLEGGDLVHADRAATRMARAGAAQRGTRTGGTRRPTRATGEPVAPGGSPRPRGRLGLVLAVVAGLGAVLAVFTRRRD